VPRRLFRKDGWSLIEVVTRRERNSIVEEIGIEIYL